MEMLAVTAFLILTGLFLAGRNKGASSVNAPRAPLIPTPSEIVRGDATKKQVIFTFDGGEGNQSADQILNILAAHHVRGTFFLTGKFVERNPDLVKRMVAEGHEVFNHTYDHPHLTELPGGVIASELQNMDDALFQTAAVASGLYFRPPYGDRDQRVLDAAAQAGYRSVYWTDDALDWEEGTGMTADQVKDRILNTLQSGDIYLMHLGDTITGTILDDVFTKIEAQGYRIVSLTQGL